MFFLKFFALKEYTCKRYHWISICSCILSISKFYNLIHLQNQQVIEGERLTLTLWFTRDSAHDEDAKLLSLLSHQPSSNNNFNNPNCFLPSPASNNMYWFSNEKSGFDIRCARVQFLGYSFLTTSDLKDSSSDQSIEPFEQLNNPLTLARGDEVFDMKFINSLHALQVTYTGKFTFHICLDLSLDLQPVWLGWSFYIWYYLCEAV